MGLSAAGPAGFIAAWSILGARTDGYRPVEQAISRLAASGAPPQVAMTAAMVGLGAGLVTFGTATRPVLGRAASASVVASGLATFGVAATPLGAPARDLAHGVAATIGYATLAATPLLARGPFRRSWPSIACGVATGASLVATAVAEPSGLLQRVGLTVGHVWVVVAAAVIATGNAAPNSGASGVARS